LNWQENLRGVRLTSESTIECLSAVATEILNQVKSLQNTEVSEATAVEIAISFRALTDQCNARFLKDIVVDSIYTPTNAFPTEIKSWYFSDLNFANIEERIIDVFENLERKSYSNQIEASNRCLDTLCVLSDYLNMVLYSRLAHRIRLRQKKLDAGTSNSVETSTHLVFGDDHG
jgi:hypothetical protein